LTWWKPLECDKNNYFSDEEAQNSNKERKKSSKKSSSKKKSGRLSKSSKLKESTRHEIIDYGTPPDHDRSVTFEDFEVRPWFKLIWEKKYFKLYFLKDELRNSLDELSVINSPDSRGMDSPKNEAFPSECPLLEMVQNFPTSQLEKQVKFHYNLIDNCLIYQSDMFQIYLEGRTGFSKTNYRKKTKISLASQIQPHLSKPSMTPLDLGLESQKVFRSIGIFSHGFLAGLAFWQIILVKQYFLFANKMQVWPFPC